MSKKNLLTHTTFPKLVELIHFAHTELNSQASKAVNVCLTLRNWLIGCYIAEYELNGADRAKYGEKLIPELARHLKDVSNCNRRQLYDYLRFYQTYPQIVGAVSPQVKKLLPAAIVPSVNAQSQPLETPAVTSGGEKVPSVEALFVEQPGRLFNSLSYTHLKQLFIIDDSTKRAFYEIECIKGGWSVRGLKRQIGSLYYERSGLSKDKKKLAKLTQSSAESADPKLIIRDPYIFEFLGLKPKEVMSESHLEDELLDKLQDFLLELGHGFCFEARQKRILIGDTHNFVDLVFYHRVLKCHVLVELKLEQFNHENIGQLNTYVSWYKKNIMTEGDNPPVGILLCTQKDRTLVEYALAGMDNGLFVSKYQIELPKKEEMQRFIEEQVRETDL